jgi:NTP pyrophosphatase (non-canonical NTP hydrolase)
MPDDRLADLVAQLRRFTREREWSRFHDPKNLAMLVASEAGELLHLFRWVPNGEADAFAARPENRCEIETEVADVAIGVLLLADRVGLDLAEIVRAKIARNGEKYPAGGAELASAGSPPRRS